MFTCQSSNLTVWKTRSSCNRFNMFFLLVAVVTASTCGCLLVAVVTTSKRKGQQNDQTQKRFLPSINFWCCILCSPQCSTPPKKNVQLCSGLWPLNMVASYHSRFLPPRFLRHPLSNSIGARAGRPPAHIISTSSTPTTISTSTTTISTSCTHFDFTDDGLYAEEGLTWWSVPTPQPIQHNCIQPKFPSLFPLCTLSSPHVTRPGHTLPNASAYILPRILPQRDPKKHYGWESTNGLSKTDSRKITLVLTLSQNTHASDLMYM